MEDTAPPSVPGLPGEPDPEPEPAHSHDVEMQVIQEGGETLLRVRPDLAWLSDPARLYPVIIDPSLDEDYVSFIRRLP